MKKMKTAQILWLVAGGLFFITGVIYFFVLHQTMTMLSNFGLTAVFIALAFYKDEGKKK
ncbi:MAG: hypothetical protein LBI11_01145 [Streptococcaceae bacterium]|jgi:uncharacterized membrane protein|nr:hypothetical protein [Streptococcaceae bacterium]